MKIGVIGTGYVGLVTGVMLANNGQDIICLDKSNQIVSKLKSGECTIYEKDLDIYLNKAINSSKISFTDSYEDISDSEAVFICVGTPSNEDGSANLDYAFSAIESVIKNTNKDCLIIIKSTVPPGSSKEFQKFIHDKGYEHKIANNPEFLREGSAIYDFMNPDRIVVGVTDSESEAILRSIYDYELKKNTNFVVTDLTSGEMIKYVSNSFLSIKISFINEMADLCEKIDANIHDLSKAVGMDKRIGSLFLNPGPGYGGSCFPKDTRALQKIAEKNLCSSQVLEASVKSNLDRYSLMAQKIMKNTKGKSLCILGMSFKAGTDDIRESPAVEIMKILVENGYRLNCYDPISNENFKLLNIQNAETFDNIYDAAQDADSIVILTEWEEFKHIDLDKLYNLSKGKILFDLRNILNREMAIKSGFKIFNIGLSENFNNDR